MGSFLSQKHKLHIWSARLHQELSKDQISKIHSHIVKFNCSQSAKCSGGHGSQVYNIKPCSDISKTFKSSIFPYFLAFWSQTKELLPLPQKRTTQQIPSEYMFCRVSKWKNLQMSKMEQIPIVPAIVVKISNRIPSVCKT